MRKSHIKDLVRVRLPFPLDLLRLLTYLELDPHCIERQIIAFTPEGRRDLAEKAKNWLERQKDKGLEFSVIVRPHIRYTSHTRC